LTNHTLKNTKTTVKEERKIRTRTTLKKEMREYLIASNKTFFKILIPILNRYVSANIGGVPVSDRYPIEITHHV